MPKKYNLGSKADMRRFERDFERQATKVMKNQVARFARTAPIEIQCPSCERSITARSGISTCPHCKCSIDLNLNIEYQ